MIYVTRQIGPKGLDRQSRWPEIKNGAAHFVMRSACQGSQLDQFIPDFICLSGKHANACVEAEDNAEQ
jgi:hypothetical protein